MDSTDARIFHKVAETLSFTVAAEQLHMSRSAVSKRIAQLERNLGTALLYRTPRSISLTEAGKTLFEHCREIDRALELAEESIKNQDQLPIGSVLVSLPTSLGAALMPGLIKEFSQRYPQVTLHVHFAEVFVDIVGGGYDVVIRVAQKLGDSSLVAQRLDSSRKVLVAAPDYLEEHGTPTHVRDLVEHRCLGLAYGLQARGTWRFSGEDGPVDVPIEYAFTANNDLALTLAACLGMGFLFTPELLVSNELRLGRLISVLPTFCDRLSYGIYAITPQRQTPAKVKVFIDFVRHKLAGLEQDDRWTPLGG